MKKKKTALLQRHLFDKLIKSGMRLKEIIAMYQHWSWEDMDNSKIILGHCIKFIREQDWCDLKSVFEFIMGYLDFTDNLFAKRLHHFLHSFLLVMDDRRKLPKKTRECYHFLIRISKELEGTRQWLDQNKELWEWIGPHVSQQNV